MAKHDQGKQEQSKQEQQKQSERQPSSPATQEREAPRPSQPIYPNPDADQRPGYAGDVEGSKGK